MSKEKLLLIGAGGFGRVVSELARRQYDCAFVDDGIEADSVICDIPVVGHTDDIKKLFSEYKKAVITIGNNSVRENIYITLKDTGYQLPNLISDTAYISPYAKFGEGCVILNHVMIQNGSVLGNCCLLNPGVELHQDCTVNDFVTIYTNSVIRTYATVGKGVRIGSNTTICVNATVEEGTDVLDCVAYK